MDPTDDALSLPARRANLTAEEVRARSTERERWAHDQWERLQREAKENGNRMGETALLEASEACGILVERNKRLGLIP